VFYCSHVKVEKAVIVEYSERNILSKHNEEEIYNISNSVSCHKSGNEHDTKENGTLDENGKYNVKNYIKSKDKNEKRQKEKDDDWLLISPNCVVIHFLFKVNQNV
jgi:hypothetical protein